MSGIPNLTPLDKEIGERAKAIRKRYDLTQEQMAEIMGCGSVHLSMLERGERAWTTKYIYAACSHFGIPAAEFFGAVEMSPQDKKLFDDMKELISLKIEASQSAPKKKPK